MFEKFTDRARRVTVQATRIADSYGNETVEPTHLLLAMIEYDRPVADALEAAGAQIDRLRDSLEMPRVAGPSASPTLGREAGDVLNQSTLVAQEMGQSLVVPLHIAIAITRSGVVREHLSSSGLDEQVFEQRAEERMPGTQQIEARCTRCGAPTEEYGKVKELALEVEGGGEIHLYAYYCGKCGSTYGLVKG